MARKKIREYNSKTLLKVHAARLGGLDLPIRVAQVKADTDFGALVTAHPWLNTTPLVVKPDCLFGKRGKHDLVGLKLDLAGAEDFIAQRMGKVINMGTVSGPIDCFIIEPFVPHDAEYYLCIQSTRAGTDLSFSEAGGVEIEEHWDQVRSVSLAVGEAVTGEALAPLLATLPLELRPGMEAFLATAHAVFTDLDFTLMEMNPFTLGPDGAPFPLDMRGELDDTAAFRSAKKWGDLEFPLPFGRRLGPAEAAVARMDEGTGASLKLSVLNPRGRVWTMVAGGGASVIYADTVGDLGAADELGNYAEYSGGPNAAETHAYALRLLDCATAGPDGRARALIVGGGIANFTDVAATFKGIIQAIRERADAVKAARLKLFVRRGGPNYRAGLDAMRALGSEIGIDIEVYGPEASMTGICKLAIDHLKDSDARDAKAAQ
ncbi:ACLA1 [Auxenochlorella protothecoides x Auxenochlorella symbiontica]